MNEKAFQDWYAMHANRLGLNPDPDDPLHHYDYRAAFRAGLGPDEAGHWPSQFKMPDHPNRFVDGMDTITGRPMDQYASKRVKSEREELDQWMEEQVGAITREKEGKRKAREEKAKAQEEEAKPTSWAPKGAGKETPQPKEEALEEPTMWSTDIGDIIGAVINPAELPSLFAGGAWQAYRMGFPVLKTGLDWTAMGIPSLAKGMYGFARGLIGQGEKAAAAAAEKAEPVVDVAGQKVTGMVSKGKEALAKILAPEPGEVAAKPAAQAVKAAPAKEAAPASPKSVFPEAPALDVAQLKPEQEITVYAGSMRKAYAGKVRSKAGAPAYVTPDPKVARAFGKNVHELKVKVSDLLPSPDLPEGTTLAQSLIAPGEPQAVLRPGEYLVSKHYGPEAVKASWSAEVAAAPKGAAKGYPTEEVWEGTAQALRASGKSDKEVAKTFAARYGKLEDVRKPLPRTIDEVASSLHDLVEDPKVVQTEVADLLGDLTGKAGAAGGQKGAAAVSLAPRLAGAAGGAAVGAKADEEHPVRGALIGAGVGFAAGTLAGKMLEGGRNVQEEATAAEALLTGLDRKIADSAKKVEELYTSWDKVVETARRGHIGHEEARIMGQELGMTVQRIKNLYPGTAMNAEQASALIDTIRPIADQTILAAKRYMQTQYPKDLHEALSKFIQLMQLDPKRYGVLAEAGRTLSQMNEPMSGVNQYLDQFGELFANAGPEDMTPEVLTAMLAELRSPEQLAIMARHAAKPGSLKAWSQAILEGWVMGLLTGPKTHAVNFISNTVTALMGPAERELAALMSIGQAGKHVHFGEGPQMVYGIIESFSDALSMFARVMKTGQSQIGVEKVESYGRRAISAEALNLSGPLGRAADVLGEFIRLPGRALVAADDMFKIINSRAQIRALAYRDAAEKGLQGKEMAEHILEFITAPSTRAVEESRSYAAYMTFTKELDGLALTMQNALEKHPALRMILPFWRTPVNIFKFSLERTPGLNLLSSHMRADIAAGGVRRDLALGKMAMGAMLASTFYLLARAGYITGSGPKDKNLRAIYKQAGWQPDSVKIGKQYISLSRVDPVSTFLGTVADLAEVSDQLDHPTLAQLAMGYVLGFANHSVTKTYLTGVTGVLDAMKEPDKSAVTYLQTWAKSLTPAVVRMTEQQLDPTLRDMEGPTAVQRLINTVKSTVPGWSETLPPMRNLKGDPIVSEGALGPDMLSAFYLSTEKSDPVWKEIKDNRVEVGPMSRYIGGTKPPRGMMTQEELPHGVELTPQEYDWVTEQAGNKLKVDGKGMWDVLSEKIASPEYKSLTKGPYGGRAAQIQSIVNMYRELALAKLRSKDKPLDELLTKKEIDRVKALTGGGGL